MADGLTELRFGGTRVALCGMRTAHFYELSYVILEQKLLHQESSGVKM
jgi:hypothetical protein